MLISQPYHYSIPIAYAFTSVRIQSPFVVPCDYPTYVQALARTLE